MKTITGYRSLDLTFFFGILFLLLISTPRLLVYYRSTPSDVTVVAVAGDGVRVLLDTPEPFRGIQPGIHSTERLIRAFAETASAENLAPANGHLEWSIKYFNLREQEKASRILISNASDKNE